MYLVYVSKYNSSRGKQVILLMISNGETQREAKSEGQRWYYLVVKKLSTLIKRMTSKHHGDFYCLNCFHSFATEKKFKLHKRVCENKDFCNVIMLSEETNRAPFIVNADLECIIEKTDASKNNPENSSATKVSKHIP